MKELNLGDTVYHLGKYTDIESFSIVEKNVSETNYLGKYNKNISYVAMKHPVKIKFKESNGNFRAEDGSVIFTSTEHLLEYIVDILGTFEI